MVKVSFISTVYNGASFLDAAISSVLNQDFKDYEFIIVDDGSTDDTARLIENVCLNCSKIKFLKSERIGRVNALNRAVSAAQGEYIANLDIDDIAFKNRAKEQASLLDSNLNLGVVGSAYKIIDKSTMITFTRYPSTNHKRLKTKLAYMIPFSHSVAMFRKSAWKKVGGYKNVANEDLYLWFEMIKEGFEIGACSEILGIHYKHKNSYWRKNFSLTDRHRELAELQKQIIKELELPVYYYLFPLSRIIYYRLPNPLKHFVRKILISET
jgi:glycosyltransferase involved in cell wall biosynthesis